MPPARTRFLRQVATPSPSQLARLQEQLAELAIARESGDRQATLALLGELGEAYRMLGFLDEARPLLTEAVEVADRHADARRALVNRLRLATLLQYAEEHDAALPLFGAALARAEALGLLVDYVRQHRGKCLAELGRWDEAIADFEAALAARARGGDAALITSSREALELARRCAAAEA